MRYVNDCGNKFAVDLRTAAGGGRRITELLWGDPLHPTGETRDGFSQVLARGIDKPGWIPSECIGDDGA